MSIKMLPAIEYLRTCFDYAPATGELHWKTRPQEHFPSARTWRMWNKQRAGMLVGYVSATGHLVVGLDVNHYQAHRLIWKWMTGEEPPPCLDHKDRNGLNNRWNNLRPATSVQSIWNTIHKNTSSGYRGVYQSGRKWRARIRRNGVCYGLGTFATVEEAAAAYEVAARELHGEFHYRG